MQLNVNRCARRQCSGRGPPGSPQGRPCDLGPQIDRQSQDAATADCDSFGGARQLDAVSLAGVARRSAASYSVRSKTKGPKALRSQFVRWPFRKSRQTTCS